jgi:hypothetical protein
MSHIRSGVKHVTHFRIEKRRCDNPDIVEINEWTGNIALNEGLNLIADLFCGAGGTAFDSAHAYIGVGDSSTAAAATQTGLQASTNKAWAGMASGYPTSGTNQQAVYRAIFESGVANFAWEEFTLGNSNDDSGENFMRATASKGTKVAGEQWTVTITVTFS